MSSYAQKLQAAGFDVETRHTPKGVMIVVRGDNFRLHVAERIFIKHLAEEVEPWDIKKGDPDYDSYPGLGLKVMCAGGNLYVLTFSDIRQDSKLV